MIRKLAAVPGFRFVLARLFLAAILAGPTALTAQQSTGQQAPDEQTPAQQTPAQAPDHQAPAQQAPAAQQQPENQQSGNQEAAPEETVPRRKKPHEYKNWTFNAAGGASLTSGTTRTYVRSGGEIAAAGVARNYSQYFGFRLDFQFDDLPLRNSALGLAQAPGANSHVYSLMLDPIFNIPVTKQWSGYFLAGPSFYHRSGKLNSSAAIPGSPCNGFWMWWGRCFNASLPLSGDFITASLNEFGENFGGGVARKIRPNLEVYVEFRYLHGARNNVTTDLRPITLGLRW